MPQKNVEPSGRTVHIVTLEDQHLLRVSGQCQHMMTRPQKKRLQRGSAWVNRKTRTPHGQHWTQQCPNSAAVIAADGKHYCHQHAPGGTNGGG